MRISVLVAFLQSFALNMLKTTNFILVQREIVD